MAKDQKIEAYSMRLDGASIREIADKFGVSFQYIQQLVPYEHKRKISKKYSSYVYPNIVKFLIENEMTMVDFSARCGMAVGGMQQFLRGIHGGSKSTVDKILKVTGMTYEECFTKEPTDET